MPRKSSEPHMYVHFTSSLYGDGVDNLSLAQFGPMLYIYTPWKPQKISDLLIISKGIKMEHWPEMG